MQSEFNQRQFAENVELLATNALSGEPDGASYRAARLVQALAEEQCQSYIGTDHAIDCRAGCACCCIVNVSILHPEALSVVDHLVSSRSQAELHDLHKRLSDLDRETRWLDDEERIMVRKKCAFLNHGRSCIIYPARPLLCRAVTSTDANACKEALAMVAFDENRPVMANLLQQEIFETAFSSLGKALENCGMDSRSHRLTGSVRTLLEKHLH